MNESPSRLMRRQPVVVALNRTKFAATRLLDRAHVDALSHKVQGRVILPGHDGYDSARSICNASIDRYPAAIVRPAGTADVQAAVDFASGNELPLSVRSGGHAVSGAAIADGGVTIDLRSMKGIRIDPERRIARAETGLNWAEFNAETQQYGLTVPSGKLSSIGVGGLTLGGGLGWLVRKYGLTIDHVRSAEIVTADGRALTTSAGEHPDLFWAIRGGGGNFGVVTSFEFDLLPLATIYGGLVGFPFPLAAKALRTYRDVIATAPEELTTVAGLMTGPDGSRLVAFGVAYAGPAAEGEPLLRPLLEIGEPVMSVLGEVPHGVLLQMFETGGPDSMGLRIRAGFVDGFDDGLIEELVARFAVAPPSHPVVAIAHLGGAMARVATDATAFPHRGERLALEIVGGWHGQTMAEETVRWVLDLWRTVQPHTTGAASVGFLDDEGPERVKAAYGPNYDRLVAIKRRYDPTNLFKFNHNISPE
jgi:FAD/FMN-containing dehydrogenase